MLNKGLTVKEIRAILNKAPDDRLVHIKAFSQLHHIGDVTLTFTPNGGSTEFHPEITISLGEAVKDSTDE